MGRNMAYNSDSKMARLVRGLFEGTQNGKINWARSDEEGVFKSEFSNYKVTIQPGVLDKAAENERKIIAVEVLDKDGDTIDRFHDEDFAPEIFLPGALNFAYMDELYQLARRRAMGIETALDSILQDLGT
jgi:hypothetical protein